MNIYIASDHGGFKLKEAIKNHLKTQGYNVIDCGAETFDINDDYPDFIAKAAQALAAEPESRGIVFGGSGQGEAMVANRFKGVRCAVFYSTAVAKEAIDMKGNESADPFEILKLSRRHNDANMLSFGARFVDEAEAVRAVDAWLSTPFANEARHLRRLKKF